MIFDFLLKRLRRTGSRETLAGDEDEDEDLDPLNPFPDPVVIPFRDVLDLHSIPPKQVRAVVEDYLAEAHARGCPGVRIIHGKGIGVQREIVRAILARTAFVVHFTDAPGDAGGWGATVVTLGIKKP
jgi:dsDNA-specific endonuclease/ATPase MutS2